MTISLLRYPGGKTRAVDGIKALIHSSSKELVSPFLGGASVEISCARDGIKVFGSDDFNPLVNFWKQAKENPTHLAAEIERHFPLEKSEFYKLQKEFNQIQSKRRQAAVFFALNRSSFSGTTLSGGMSPGHPRFTQKSIQRVREFQADNLSVELLDWKEALEAHPDKLLYLDPPYAIASDNLYGKNGDKHKGFNHQALAAALRKRDGWILSYNDDPYIRQLYKGFKISTPKWTYGMGNNKQSNEVLITNL